MKKKLSIAATGTALLATLAFAPIASANSQTNQQGNSPATSQVTPAQQAAPATDFSDQDIKTYVAAAEKVNEITNEYRPKVQSAPSEADQQVLIQQADQDMVRAIRAEGISVDKFLQINQAVQVDQSLANRVTQMIN
ncbi:DUF4168 domain-containing protein [Orrella marina]|uniref:DUF4168 domain-containing protein n=1 Tax=Orrella marina TaxID=2163011 RepID=A0A2R4XIQ3_9BURK|nr:DUF4168 domain-containing protein [Orrella marina]AWB33633.1 hypothetical protein DBV39_07830 [Orrella marina]